MTRKKLSISVNIPVHSIDDATVVLDSIRKISFPEDRYEIILVEGEHIAKQRNRAYKKSKGDIIYLLDDDSQIQQNAFKIVEKEFEDPKVAAVGGPSITSPHNVSYVSILIGYALGTYFGAMRMRYRYSSQTKKHTNESEYQLIGANLAIRRRVLQRLKGFDEKIVPNEETELLRRIKKAGYKLTYNEKLFIYRDQRKSIISLIEQFFRYGKGRMKQIQKIPTFEDLIFLAPILFLLYIVILPFIVHIVTLLPLFSYMLLGIVTSIKVGIKYKRVDVLVVLPLVFFIIHLSYALGLMSEFVVSLLVSKETKRKMKKISVIFVKKFP